MTRELCFLPGAGTIVVFDIGVVVFDKIVVAAVVIVVVVVIVVAVAVSDSSLFTVQHNKDFFETQKEKEAIYTVLLQHFKKVAIGNSSGELKFTIHNQKSI